MRKSMFVFGLLIMVVAACSKEGDDDKNTPGYFRLTPVGIPETKSTVAKVHVSNSPSFHLGDIKGSRSFFFILSNGGEQPVFDIKLETNHPAFEVSPGSISVLMGRDSTDGLIPLISLDVIHGRQINGVGFAPLLTMGENECMLKITGKTLDGNDTLDIASSFTIGVNVKVMNITVFQGPQEIDLTHPVSVVMGGRNFGGLGAVRYYYVSTPTISLHNTGNVDIDLSQIDFNSDNIYVDRGMTQVKTGQSLEVTIDTHITYIVLESNGTITDDSRIQLGNDGKGYFAIIPQP